MNLSLDKEKQRIKKAISKRLKRLRRSLLIKQQELQECTQQQDWENQGNLLKCAYHRLHIGMKEVEVEDLYHDGLMRVIVLDEAKTPAQNIAACFAYARKLGKRVHILPRVLEEMMGDIENWEAVLRQAEEAQSVELLSEIKDRYQLLHPAKKEKELSSVAAIFHSFYSASGHHILVGKNAIGNDILTFQKASGEDIWLHAHGCPGSHVIIRKKEQFIDRETLLDAMHLALYFSKRRGDMQGSHEVLYAKRNQVSKRKGAPKGQVVVAGGSIETLQCDPHRIACLKGGSKSKL